MSPHSDTSVADPERGGGDVRPPPPPPKKTKKSFHWSILNFWTLQTAVYAVPCSVAVMLHGL